ncbi:RdRP-domain-containing protein [Eremomyces bilateralis CBS 781.70]|uniref:RNA-dependent RNA polymerase n=1 Tax=Eremomyces bilateralis CBS 781.70 TaxID=1392243 RepID=A0A6G1FW37_9PEZI|nr:RdRP-domain-containing protein [Eremomyces bilateralis CBS 781.70]KAF1809900.1 RdRP-domain-containing protein [Eremomyces bilateralis CBS 781.70]
MTFVIFGPPPQTAIWQFSYISIEYEGKTHKAQVTLCPPVKERIHRSPVNQNRIYPERTELHASSLDIGLMHTADSMMTMMTVAATERLPISLVLQLFPNRRQIGIEFHIADDSSARSDDENEFRRYQLEIDVSSSVTEVFEDASSPDTVTLVLPSINPPNAYRRVKDIDIKDTHDTDSIVWHEMRAWPRVTEVKKPNLVDPRSKRQLTSTHPAPDAPIQLNRGDSLVDIGRWTTFRMVFPLNNDEARRSYYIIRSVLRDYNVNVKRGPNPTQIPRQESTLWKQINELPSTSNTQVLGHQIFPLPFDVRYQLEVCVSQGIINEHNITEQFLTTLLRLDRETARQVLEKAADSRKRWFEPMDIIQQFRFSTYFNRRIPEYCSYSRGVTLTPTTVYFHSPAVETSNRVTRKYESRDVQFIRIKFMDERTWGKMRNRHDRNEAAVYNRFRHALRHGIQIGQRVFYFLAWGNSQFRENGAYFISPTSSITADSIRAWMGDVAHIRVIAKYAARLGQNFSTTRSYRGSPVEMVEIPDIERNGYCFTDGVGKMSRFISQMIANRFRLPFGMDDPPSVIQFRYGGCKGVLALDPTMVGKQNHQIQIRPSQRKFEVTEGGLEITRCSDFSVATLNRQLIAILSSHGIPDYVFDDMRERMVRDLDLAMRDENVALRLLQKNIDMNQTSLALAAMIAEGFMERREPFLTNCLQLWRCWNMKLLKEKARLVVEKAAFVLGCVDETGLLQGHFDEKLTRHHETKEDLIRDLPQIFIQVGVSEKAGEKKQYHVITGLCILARNPSLHPGDIRVVNAVDVPALHHLKNVVALPQTGDRDLGSMCSGGDLDGDDYFVSWDENLLFTDWSYPPMAHTAPPPKEVNRPVVMDDLSDFFIEYMKNDSLPTIATAHLAIADSEGVESETCLELAELHSLAVDYPKSGHPVRMERRHFPTQWPHFMERRAKTYTSRKILGKLYDRVSSVYFRPVFQGFNYDIIASYQTMLDAASWERLKGKARNLKGKYDDAVRRIQARHDIKTEFEVWTVYCLSHNGEKRDYTFAEDMGRDIGGLKEEFRALVRQEAEAMDGGIVGPEFRPVIEEAEGNHLGVREVDLILHPFLAAMYCVAVDEATTAVKESRMMATIDGIRQSLRNLNQPSERPMMSFPWIFYEELGKISRLGGLLRKRMAGKVRCAELLDKPAEAPLNYDQSPHEDSTVGPPVHLPEVTVQPRGPVDGRSDWTDIVMDHDEGRRNQAWLNHHGPLYGPPTSTATNGDTMPSNADGVEGPIDVNSVDTAEDPSAMTDPTEAEFNAMTLAHAATTKYPDLLLEATENWPVSADSKRSAPIAPASLMLIPNGKSKELIAVADAGEDLEADSDEEDLEEEADSGRAVGGFNMLDAFED